MCQNLGTLRTFKSIKIVDFRFYNCLKSSIRYLKKWNLALRIWKTIGRFK